MSVILFFLLVIVGIAGWWLSQQRLMSKPWLETGSNEAFPGTESGMMPVAKVGVGVFLAVVGCLFALFTSAYFMRMGLSDWHAMPVPRLLWLNTGVLVLSSVALQIALIAARRRQLDMVRLGLVTDPKGQQFKIWSTHGVSHWIGTGWSPLRIPDILINTPFTAVGGSGPTDVWVLAAGYALKVAANNWDLTEAISSNWRAAALSPLSSGGIWVLFQDGATPASRLYRVTGTDPTTDIGPMVVAPAGLNDLWAAPDGTLWGAGAGGALIRRRPVP